MWAPNAQRVSVVGDFNDWDGRRHPMRKRVECGVWEIFVPGAHEGAHYKYEIAGPQGDLLPLKADPLARFAQAYPPNASILCNDATRRSGAMARGCANAARGYGVLRRFRFMRCIWGLGGVTARGVR